MSKFAYYDVREIKDLRDMLYQSSRLYADSTALKIKREPGAPYEDITYRRLRQEVDALGTALMKLFDEGHQYRIAIVANTRYEWYISYLSTIIGNGVIIPIDRQLEAEEIHGMFERAKVDAVFFGRAEETKVLDSVQNLPSLKYLFPYDEFSAEVPEGVEVRTIVQLMQEGEAAVEADDTRFFDVEIDPNEMRLMYFTSGTTARSKAVMHSHKTICSNMMEMCRMVYIGSKDTFLSILPLNHSYEGTCGFLVPLYRGSTIAICEGYRHIMKNLKESNATIMLLVPLIAETIHQQVMRKLKADPAVYKRFKRGRLLSDTLFKVGIDIRRKIFKQIHEAFGGSLRLIVSGGAAIDPQVLDDFESLGLLAIQGYGLTEFAPLIAVNRDIKKKSHSAGLATPLTDVRVDEPDENGIGEIVATSPSLMLGYYEDEEATAKAMRSGSFHTSDLGYIDEEGFIILTGRKQNVIVNKTGKNIYPEELEFHFGKSDWIQECIVMTEPAPRGEDLLVLEVYPNETLAAETFGQGIALDSPLIEAEIDAIIREGNESLPVFKRIRKVNIRTEPFPKSTSQKILRHRIGD